MTTPRSAPEPTPGDQRSEKIEPDARTFGVDLSAGDPNLLAWIEKRVLDRARPRFASWAWSLIGEDFHSDLLLQLTVTTTKPDFEFRGAVRAYVDVAIMNLCRRYFRIIARTRKTDPLDSHGSDLREETAVSLDEIGSSLELRRALLAASSACRQLLLSKYIEELTMEEIAQRDGAPAKTIMSRLHECRKRMRSWFDRQRKENNQDRTRSGLLSSWRSHHDD